jgi:hypothetical protein
MSGRWDQTTWLWLMERICLQSHRFIEESQFTMGSLMGIAWHWESLKC